MQIIDSAKPAAKWPLLLLPLVLLLTYFIVGQANQPPTPPTGVAADQVSPEKLASWVERIAATPHITASDENRRVRDLIVAELARLGMKPEIQAGFSARQSPRFPSFISGAQIENIIAVLPGKNRQKPAVALMAHYDSVPFAPGAGDDAAGTAALLETARLLAAGAKPERDVVFLITDGEEIGLLGATKFFAEHPLASRIGAVVNVEARGSAGRALMFQTSPNNAALIELWAESALHPTGNSLSDAIYKLLPNDTDLSVSLAAGKIGINGAFSDGLADYHAPSDSPANLNPGSLYHLASFAFTTTAALASAPALPQATSNATYFDIFGLGVVRYPAVAGWALIILAAAGLGWLIRAETRAGLGWGRLLGAVIGTLGMWALAGIAAHFAVQSMFASHSLGSVARTIAMPSSQWVASLVAASVAILFLPRATGLLASLILLFAASLAAQIRQPAGAWIFAVPLVAALIVAIIAQKSGSASAKALVAAMVIGGFMFALVMQTVDTGWASVGTMTAGITALAVPYAMTLFGPLILPWSQATRRLVPAGLSLVAALILGTSVVRSEQFDQRHPKPHDLFHLTTPDGKSWWATTSGEDSLPGGKGNALPLDPPGRAPMTATPAPAMKTPRPVLTTGVAQGVVTINLKSDAPARAFRLSIKPSRDLVGAKLNNVPLTIKGGEWVSIRFGGASIPDLRLTFAAGKGGKVEISSLMATPAPTGTIPLPKDTVASNWALTSNTLAVAERSSFAW